MARPSKTPSARLLAVNVLRDVQSQRWHSNRVLSDHLERNPGMDGRDRGFATTLTYGVLRHRRRLDHLIDSCAAEPAKIRGRVRELLRLGAFELRELDRPGGVAISQAAELGRSLDPSGGLDGMIHAVLGRIDREGAKMDEAAEGRKPLDALELRWSIPRWLAGRWIKTLGAETATARARALSMPPTVDLRIDLGRTSRDAVVERLREDHPGADIEVPAQPQALRLRGAGDVFHGPVHDEGLIAVQGLGAQQAAIALAPGPQMRVLDACAGMGTKTLQLAEIMMRRGTIVAADLDSDRLAMVERVVERGRLDVDGLDIRTVTGDLTATIDTVDDAPFDAVLVDAPCTGLGNLARHPEIRWRAQFDDIADRAALQRGLLSRCLPRVRPGGRLVYAVCSLEREEGPDVVESCVGEGFRVEAQHWWTPEEHGTDGFYLALVVRD